jgi:hypothetical protein
LAKEGKLILPYLQSNFEELHKNEKEIRTISILEINSQPHLKDHSDMLDVSLAVIRLFFMEYRSKNEEELIIQFLGARLYNSIVAALNLLLSGYYQCTTMIQRDILETGFLIDYFSKFRAEILKWKVCSEDERKKFFGPAKIRTKLDEWYGFKSQKRKQAYQLLCSLASHPSFQGFKLISKNKLVRLGSFFDEKLLRETLEELVKRVPLITIHFIDFFEIPRDILFFEQKLDFLKKWSQWNTKYKKFPSGMKDIQKLEAMLDNLKRSLV